MSGQGGGPGAPAQGAMAAVPAQSVVGAVPAQADGAILPGDHPTFSHHPRPWVRLSEVPAVSARSLAEAYAVLAERRPGLLVLARCTDVMAQLAAGVGRDRLGLALDVSRVPDLHGIVLTLDGLKLGALTTYAELQRSELVRAHAPALADVAREVGAPAIQNRGTIGGNVCTASPAGDALPLLLVMGARFHLGGPRGERTVKASHFFLAYRKTALAADELLLSIELPLGGIVRWRKVGTRRAQAISKLLIAVRVDGPGPVLSGVRVAAGCVAPVPLRCRSVEDLLEGRTLDVTLIERARAALQRDISPIDDVRSTAEHRRIVAGNVLVSLLGGM
jgi:CO/xanthine dehydrogenase FAD-binding subunit